MMDEKIAECAIEGAMEGYSRDDYGFIESLCRATIETYEKALMKAICVIAPGEPTAAQTEMDEEIKLFAITLAALDGMPPEHFYAHDDSFRFWYYRRALAAIEGSLLWNEESPNWTMEIFLAAPSFPAPIGEPCYPSAIDNDGVLYFAPLLAHRRAREVRVGGIPWDRVSADPTPGQWRQDRRRGTITLGGITGGGRVIAYLEQ